MPKANPKASNLYEKLGVDSTANDSEIKKAYYKAAKEFHPDKRSPDQSEAEANADFQEIGKAYKTLSDPNERAAYDRDQTDQHTKGVSDTSSPPAKGPATSPTDPDSMAIVPRGDGPAPTPEADADADATPKKGKEDKKDEKKGNASPKKDFKAAEPTEQGDSWSKTMQSAIKGITGEGGVIDAAKYFGNAVMDKLKGKDATGGAPEDPTPAAKSPAQSPPLAITDGGPKPAAIQQGNDKLAITNFAENDKKASITAGANQNAADRAAADMDAANTAHANDEADEDEHEDDLTHDETASSTPVIAMDPAPDSPEPENMNSLMAVQASGPALDDVVASKQSSTTPSTSEPDQDLDQNATVSSSFGNG